MFYLDLIVNSGFATPGEHSDSQAAALLLLFSPSGPINSLFPASQAGHKAFKNREKGNSHKPNTLERQKGLIPMAEVRKGEGFHIGH